MRTFASNNAQPDRKERPRDPRDAKPNKKIRTGDEKSRRDEETTDIDEENERGAASRAEEPQRRDREPEAVEPSSRGEARRAKRGVARQRRALTRLQDTAVITGLPRLYNHIKRTKISDSQVYTRNSVSGTQNNDKRPIDAAE